MDSGVPDAGRPGVDAGTPDAGFGAVPIEQWCEDLALSECHRQLRCLLLAPAQLSSCLARQRLACAAVDTVEAVHHGRLQYLPDQAGRCLNAYGHGRCFDSPAECEGLFQGQVPPDGGCVLPQECQVGSFCLPAQNVCPSHCRAFSLGGESCNFWDRQCNPDGFDCEQVDAGAYGCVPRLGLGESCTSYNQCRADLVCPSKKCVQRKSGLGETCGVVNGYPECDPDAFCRQPSVNSGATPPPGECQKRIGLGGACVAGGPCLPNLRCSSDYGTGTCQPLGSEDEVCNGAGDCKKELFCWTRTSRCLPFDSDGGDCTATGTFYACAPGQICSYQGQSGQFVCKKQGELGAPCAYGGECLGNQCGVGTLSDGGSGAMCLGPCSQRADGGL